MSFADKFKSQGSGMNATARIIREKTIAYTLWFTQSGGRKAFFIIEVDKAKDKEFHRVIESDEAIDLEDFGTIHYKGWQEPDANTKKEFFNKYGLFREEFE